MQHDSWSKVSHTPQCDLAHSAIYARNHTAVPKQHISSCKLINIDCARQLLQPFNSNYKWLFKHMTYMRQASFYPVACNTKAMQPGIIWHTAANYSKHSDRHTTANCQNIQTGTLLPTTNSQRWQQQQCSVATSQAALQFQLGQHPIQLLAVTTMSFNKQDNSLEANQPLPGGGLSGIIFHVSRATSINMSRLTQLNFTLKIHYTSIYREPNQLGTSNL
jgi:hypothetical protein